MSGEVRIFPIYCKSFTILFEHHLETDIMTKANTY